MCPRSRFAHLPLIIDLSKSHRKPRWKDHSQSECEEFMEDFFESTLSKVKGRRFARETSCKGEMAELYSPLTTMCMCMSHRQMDEAIGAEFNGFEWVQVHTHHRFGQTKRPLVPGSRSSQLTLLRPGCRRSNLTVDAQWDKMSMARRNWREWLSPHMRHDGHYSVPREQCLGCPHLLGAWFLIAQKSQAGEDHCWGFMKVFFKIELSKSRRSRVCTKVDRARAWTSAS